MRFPTLQKLRSFLTRQEKIKCLIMIVIAAIGALLEIATVFLIVVLAQVLSNPNANIPYLSSLGLSQGRLVFYTSIMVGLVYCIKNSVGAIEVFYQNFSSQQINMRLKKSLLHRYANMDYGLYLTRSASYGIQTVGSDLDLTFSNGVLPFLGLCSEGLIFLSLISLLIFMNPILALVIFSIGATLFLFLSRFVLPKFYNWGKQFQEANLESAKQILQFFHTFKEIIILNKRDSFINRYLNHSNQKLRIYAIQLASQHLPRLIIEVLFVGLFVITIACLCLQHETPVQILGILGGYFYAGFRIMPGLNRMITYLNTFKSSLPYINRVYDDLHSCDIQSRYIHVSDFDFTHSIVLNNVNFSYLNSNKMAIHNVSLTVYKGECIGIIGETGSGKSTLVDLILGLLHPKEGSILVDNQHPVHSYEWHQCIGYVPQFLNLVDDTIEANVAFGEQNIDFPSLQDAIQSAQLAQYIKQLPLGIKTLVGERGIRLSGGEKQRISIARALYRNPEVLIFDEATSALDNETESKLMETILSIKKDKTIIMIAHRVSTLKECNRIVVMDKGCIKEIKENQASVL